MTPTMTNASRKAKAEQWRQVLSELYNKFQQHGQQAVDSFDEEDIHQARVNCRKLMTLLRILDPDDTTELLPLFKKAQKRLGKVRDEDVLIDAFKQRRKQAKQQQHAHLVQLLKAVINEQKDHRRVYREQLVSKLPKLQGKKLRRKWEPFLEQQLPQLVAIADVNRLMRELEIAYEQKKQHYRHSAKQQGLEADDTLAALHQVRIAAKELRYTAEAASFALNAKFREHENVYKNIQKQLGHINDRHVWIEALEELKPERVKFDEQVRDELIGELRHEMNIAIHENERVI
ncbi:CHAD domain-containing protein [Paenibacillus campi]|uniref:CHAD domain-containing protein n=1 Tax=Paenibacillus campi TaxID=3106031 RepID=UPI002AFFE43B|nr:CHAD domain-containing protein [Paenibacillus sp. SGZ-1009]